MALVKSILTTDGIWEHIGGHGLIKEQFKPPKDWLYVIGLVDGEAVALVLVHDTAKGDKKCHVQILPEHRKEHGKEFGVKGMAWIWENTTINRMVASIPEIYQNVINYAKLQGFTIFCTVEEAYEKDGVLYDEFLLEIKRG